MDNKKFEQLIDLIINENEERASELFHEIVVEKSRQIYENIMDEEMMGMEEDMDEDMDEDMMEDDMDEGMGGQVGDLLDEINAEESGMTEDADLGHDEASEHEEIEDRVVRIEDKLDELMAEFEEIMGDEHKEHDEEDAEFDDEAEEAGHDMTHDMEKDHDEEDDEEGDEEDMDDEEEEEEESVMENINLPRVPAPKHGDNGSQSKSTYAANSGQRGMASKPVKFSGDAEAVPTGPKSPSNYGAKGEGDLPGAGKFKNTPGKNNFTEKGDSTPKPVTKDGATGKRSPVAK